MAAQAIFIPFYKDGAWHFVKVQGVYDTGNKVPEGQPMVKAMAMTATPPQRLQPVPVPLGPPAGPPPE